MFSAERRRNRPEARPETRYERELRLAREGRDRTALKHVVVAMLLIFGGMAALVAADVAGVERRLTTATVVGFIDKWNMKGGHECVTQLLTGYGDAEIYTRNRCHDAGWRVGDKDEVEARQLRFTKAVVVSTRGTIFQGAYSVLPES